MIGNNSCGMHAQMAGKTEENTYELDILTYDGLGASAIEVWEFKLDADVGKRRAQLEAARERYTVSSF